ncbi:glycosyltransferase family 4 protein [Gemmatimonas sp.]|uniref:glycosyltransferase family 4 protein n=1 Tax=Gemmatimonas sp. TaxID=1962908 RepID=UPI00286AD816|nr:glycosyltransferase family 4 protein [Gemmatimonas sp.]
MSIPSAQRTDDDRPRFHIPAFPDDPAWNAAVAAEEAGGVASEVRVFLDAQLEAGDLLIDAAPGFGFVALSATTAPGGLPTVFVAGLSSERMQSLQDAALDLGGWLDALPAEFAPGMASSIVDRLDPQGRVFVHLASAQVSAICAWLTPLLEADRVLALCVSDAGTSADWPTASAALAAVGFAPCALMQRDGEAVLLPCAGEPEPVVIALPQALVSGNDDEAQPQPGALARPAWSPPTDGFVFSTPHSRTGYGVVGSQLLRVLQARGIPVALRAIGPVDRTLAANPKLDAALVRQHTIGADVPSVRLSQQFDLLAHAGHGPRVGFTIFELDRFTPAEMSDLQQQDALIVCTEWAKQVCVANGVTVPIHVVPLGVDRAVFHERVTPKAAAGARSADTVFLQVGKLEPRKGQRELLRAFEAAFTPQDAVQLVLHCYNPFMARSAFDELAAPFRTSPMRDRITVMSRELPTARDVAELMAGADCGVFPVRAEGWNLEALEMLSMGKAVIATDATAHTAFLTAENARLIAIDALEPAMHGAVPGSWAAWGDAQHEQLVGHLQTVHAARQQGALAPNVAGIATATRLSWESSADALLAALAAAAA